MCQFHTPVIEDFDSTIIFPSHRVLLYPERTSAASQFYFQGFGGMLVLVGLLLPRKKGFLKKKFYCKTFNSSDP